MAENREWWVFSEKPDLLAELIAGAKEIGGGAEVAAVVLGTQAQAENAIRRGADRVVWLGDPVDGCLVEDYVPTIAQQIAERKPAGLLVGATTRGRAIAGRLAAQTGVAALTDVRQFWREDGEVRVRHMIFGGGAVRDEKPLTDFVLATVGWGVYTAEPEDSNRTGAIEPVSFVEPDWRFTLRERRPRGVSSVNLAAAKRVVCPGRGVARKEDLAMVEELAQVLGAEIACTRPLAEGLDWLPRERYIGISGATVKPDLYLGVGVSGQAQHTIGMVGSRVVAAINKDKEAPIFKHADYAIVGDLYAIVPALIEAVKARP